MDAQFNIRHHIAMISTAMFKFKLKTNYLWTRITENALPCIDY